LKHIAIFASGSGSNAQKIIEHFEDSLYVNVSLIVTNRCKAKVLDRAERFNIPTIVLKDKAQFSSELFVKDLRDHKIDLIVLAGFLWLIPKQLITHFPKAIINIHPALLPAFGGKGMYGMHIHRAVKQQGVLETGITIHYVNPVYDEGEIIFQKSVNLLASDTPEEIAAKVQALEHLYYPEVVEQTITRL